MSVVTEALSAYEVHAGEKAGFGRMSAKWHRLRRRVRSISRRVHARAVGAKSTGVDLGDLRRVAPINRHWGWERGVPIDRHYIELFLEEHRASIRGRVLEIGDDTYSRRFGGADVANRDVL